MTLTSARVGVSTSNERTGLGKKTVHRLREFLRQVDSEVVGKKRNKIHQMFCGEGIYRARLKGGG